MSTTKQAPPVCQTDRRDSARDCRSSDSASASSRASPSSHCPFQQHVRISCGLNAYPTPPPPSTSLLFHRRPPLRLSSAATKTRQIARFRWESAKMASLGTELWVILLSCVFYHTVATQLENHPAEMTTRVKTHLYSSLQPGAAARRTTRMPAASTASGGGPSPSASRGPRRRPRGRTRTWPPWREEEGRWAGK